jgi:hypothetical protein
MWMEFEALAIHYVLVEDKVLGPFSLRQLNEMHDAGKVPDTAFYSVKGIEGWHPITELFKPTIVKPPPPLGSDRRTESQKSKGTSLPPDSLIGLLVILIGQVLAVYFFGFYNPPMIQAANGPFDPTLLYYQQNGMLLGLGIMLLGGLLYVAGAAERSLRNPGPR